MNTATAHRATADPCPYRRNGGHCPDMTGPARGDVILVGTGGDDPETALRKIIANHAAYLTAPQWPAAHTVGEVTRVRAGQVVEYRDAHGVRHPVKVGPGAVTLYRYAHQETLRGSLPGTVAAVTTGADWLAAEARLLTSTRPNLRRCAHTA